LVLLFFVLSLMVYWATSAGRTPYDYFTRLADSFLEGKYYLTQNPSWLSELIPAGLNKFYVVYPPMPAILAMPFRLVLENRFEQQYLAHLLGAGIVVFTMLTTWKIKRDKKLLVWMGILASAGTIMWFLSATGSSWYLGQISAVFFMSAAVFIALNKKRPFLVGILLGAAFLSRLHTILCLPLILYLLFDQKNWLKRYFYLGMGIAPFVLFNFYYNFVRFGTIFDQAYFLLPKILNETNAPWFIHGVLNAVYIPNNLKTMFWSFPKFLDKVPYIQPSWNGLSIWITTPAFIYALKSDFKKRLTQASWLSIILILAVVISHGGNGFAQFGYRFAVDFYPILIFLIITGIAKTGLRWHHWLLLFFGVLVNMWGVIFINKFGWVGF
jgi:hypothetical protein